MATLRDLYTHHQANNEVAFSLTYLGQTVWFGIVGGPKHGLWLVEYSQAAQEAQTVDWELFGCEDPADWTGCLTLVCAVFSKLTGKVTHVDQLHQEIAIEMMP